MWLLIKPQIKPANRREQIKQNILQNAKILWSSKDFRGAAKALESINMVDQAVNMLIENNLHVDAARTLVRNQQYQRAARLLASKKEWQLAAESFTMAKSYSEAAKCFAIDKQYGKAADVFLEAADLPTAAKYYEKAGNRHKAAKMHLEMKNEDKSISLYKTAFSEDPTMWQSIDVSDEEIQKFKDWLSSEILENCFITVLNDKNHFLPFILELAEKDEINSASQILLAIPEKEVLDQISTSLIDEIENREFTKPLLERLANLFDLCEQKEHKQKILQKLNKISTSGAEKATENVDDSDDQATSLLDSRPSEKFTFSEETQQMKKADQQENISKLKENEIHKFEGQENPEKNVFSLEQVSAKNEYLKIRETADVQEEIKDFAPFAQERIGHDQIQIDPQPNAKEKMPAPTEASSNAGGREVNVFSPEGNMHRSKPQENSYGLAAQDTASPSQDSPMQTAESNASFKASLTSEASEILQNLFAQTRLLRDLNAIQLNLLWEKGSVKKVKKNEPISTFHDHPKKVYIILSGEAVCKTSDQALMIKKEFTARDSFGEHGIFSTKELEANYFAKEDCMILEIQGTDLLNLMRDDQSLTMCLYKNFTDILLQCKNMTEISS